MTIEDWRTVLAILDEHQDTGPNAMATDELLALIARLRAFVVTLEGQRKEAS